MLDVKLCTKYLNCVYRNQFHVNFDQVQIVEVFTK